MATEPDVLVVATFNIRNGRALDGRHSWPLRRRSAAAAVRALDADTLGLQEAFGFQLRYLQRIVSGYDAVGLGRGGETRGERCPVLVRSVRLTIDEHETRWFGAPADARNHPSRLPGATFPRIATIVQCNDRVASRSLQVINVHLDEHRRELRAASVAQLATWFGDAPTIVLGDFNTADESEVFEPLTARGLCSVLAPDAIGTAHDFRGRTDGPRLDHILVSDHFEVRDAQVVTERFEGRVPSDHWPVRAVLAWR